MTFLGVFGHVVLDHVLRVPQLPAPNTSIQVTDSRQSFGGTAGTLARAAAHLGVETALAAFVGEDFPAPYRESLRAEGVDVTDLRTVAGHRTPTAWIFSEPGGNQMTVIDQGAMADPDREVLEHTVRASDLVHIATGRPEYYAKVVRLAHRLDKRVAFDPAQEIHYVYDRGAFADLFNQADLFFGNRREFEKALAFLDLDAVAAMAEGDRILVQTRGVDGSVVYAPEGAWRIPAIPASRVGDVTGAGDVYRAGFYAGLHRGMELPFCGLLGAAAASVAVEGDAPQTRLPTWEEALGRAEAHRGEIEAL